MRRNDTSADVRALQHHLAGLGYSVETSGLYDESTEDAVRQFQQLAGLVADGIAGDKTLLTLRRREKPEQFLSQGAIESAAKRLGVPVASIQAVNEVESRGSGFLENGQPVILFERHVMYQRLCKIGKPAAELAALYPDLVNPQRGGYAGGTAEHGRMASAFQIDSQCALESASWGLFQIMGYHWQALGYSSVDEFVLAMQSGEDEQLDAFVRFIEADPGLHKALNSRNWAEFARRYNGAAYKENRYDVKLASAYERHAGAGEA